MVWTNRRSADDVAAIASEVAAWLEDTVRLQRLGERFIQDQRARHCADSLVDDAITEQTAEIVAELLADQLVVE